MQDEKTDLNKAHQTLVIVWAALLFSQVLFLLMIYLVKREVFVFDFSQPIGGGDPILVMALAGVSVVSFFLSISFRRKFVREAIGKQEVKLVQTGMIIGCALGESITLFGLLLVFIENYSYFYFFFALGILAILLSYPRRGDVMAAGFR
jgi:hypothetical protein